ncbi:MAG TPA: transglycosylase SLT domain-containing protein [Thermoanaerobaculia bacterium]
MKVVIYRLSVVGCLGLAFACGHAPAPVTAPAPVPVPQVVPVPPPTPRELAKSAIAQGDATLLAQAADADPRVAPWLHLRQADALAKQGRFADAAQVESQIIAAASETTAATTARLRLPALYAHGGDATTTNAAFTAAMQVPIDETTEEDLVKLANDLDSAQRADLATVLRLHLLNDYTQGRFTEQTYTKIANATPSPLDTLTVEQSLALAQQLAKYDRYDQEFDLLGRLVKRSPDAQTNALYHATRIRAQFHSRHYTELLNETAGEKLTDPSLALLRARAAWRVGKNPEFLAGVADVEKTWPASSQASEARVLEAKFFTTDIPDYDHAIVSLRGAIAANDFGADGENLWSLAWTLFLAGRNDEALQTLDDYVKRYPDGDYRSNALFWSGKILGKLGRTAERDAKWRELILEYPYGYFSYRARQLEAPPNTEVTVADAGGSAYFPNVAPAAVAANEPRIEVVRELQAIGLTRDAAVEMKRVASLHPNDLAFQFLLADVYVEGGEPFKANGILQRHFREFVRHGGINVPHRFWEILYPLKYWDAYQAAAAKQNVDPYLLVAVTRQESGFEPSTVSNAGAVGLMQIMPAEAGAIATKAGLLPPSREQLFDPATNIQIGAAEFAQKLASMQNNPVLAIAAYNAGEDAVGKWLAHTPIDDLDLFVEAIPYAETRLYVKTVTRNRFEYRRIYDSSTNHPEPSH